MVMRIISHLTIQPFNHLTMNSIHVSIVGGGKLSKKLLPQIAISNYRIGVDHGAYWLIVNEIIPDVAIGDFDSVTPREMKIIRKQSKRMNRYPKKKDKTDMELAIARVIDLHPKEVRIYGAVGDRLDHTMVNMHLLERLHDAGIPGVIVDETNEVRMVDNRLSIKKDSRLRYVSVIPVTESILVTLTGCVYNLSRKIIRRGETLGISNEILKDEATIEVHEGKALVIRSRD